MLERAAIGLLRAAKRLPRGHTRLAFTLPRLIPGLRERRVQTRYGPMTLDMREEICHPLFVYGEYPHWRGEEHWLAKLPLDGVVLDIGANIGAMTVQFARTAKHVHAFEPSPRALRLLRFNAPENCTVHAVALGDHNGRAYLEEAVSTDVSHIADHGTPVAMRTVDSLGLEPDFIKIDVEGYEPAVLRGATETLRAGPPIMFEALSADAFGHCKAAVLKANQAYEFTAMGGINYLASVTNM